MALGDILSGLTGAATGVEAGIANRRELERRARMDLIAEQLKRAEIQHLLQPPPARNIDPLSPEGIRAAIERGKALQQDKPEGYQIYIDPDGGVHYIPKTPTAKSPTQVPPGGATPQQPGGVITQGHVPPKEPNEKERVAASQAQSISESVDRMEEIARRNPKALNQAITTIRAGHYGFLGKVAQDVRNVFTDPDAQQFFTDYNNYLLAVTPTYGGARPTQQLMDLETNASLPGLAAGGSALEAALKHMRERAQDVRAKAGRAAKPSQGGAAPPKAPAPKAAAGAPGYNPKFWKP